MSYVTFNHVIRPNMTLTYITKQIIEDFNQDTDQIPVTLLILWYYHNTTLNSILYKLYFESIALNTKMAWDKIGVWHLHFLSQRELYVFVQKYEIILQSTED